MNYSHHYLAGVIDSDGSISVAKRHLRRKTPNYTIMLQISWNYSKSAENYFNFLKQSYGGSYFIGPHHKSGYKNASLTIKYCATGRAAERILLSIRNNLVLKTEQAHLCLQVLQLVKEYKGKRRPKNISLKLEKFWFKNKNLNKSKFKI